MISRPQWIFVYLILLVACVIVEDLVIVHLHHQSPEPLVFNFKDLGPIFVLHLYVPPANSKATICD